MSSFIAIIRARGNGVDEKVIHFRAAARHQHMAHAAEELGITQSALSRSVARFERDYGVQLFDRVGRTIRLNAYGRIVLVSVDEALLSLENGRRRVRELVEREPSAVTIGFTATLGANVLPSLIGAYREIEQDMRFELVQGSYRQLRAQLLKGEIDICIASPAFADARLGHAVLWDEALLALVPAHHPLARRAEIALAELANDPWIALQPATGMRRVLDRLTRESGIVPTIAIEPQGISTIQGLVRTGFGVSLVPQGVFHPEEGVVALRVREPHCARTFCLSWLEGRYLNPGVVAFREFAVTNLSQLKPSGLALA
jgi:DNA-binding transcriptional LysR family regulator